MEDTRKIEIEYAVSREASREAYRYIYHEKVRPRNFIWIGVILVIYCAYSFYTRGFSQDDLWYYLPLLGIPLGLLITTYYLPRKWGDKLYKQYSGKKMKWVITEWNIEITATASASTVEWSYFKRAVISNGVILMFTAGNNITPIPIDAFKSDDFEQFKIWVEKNL